MGKVVIKQGFLGLGRPLEKWCCDQCGAECENRYWQANRVFCLSCANSIDPEIVHDLPALYRTIYSWKTARLMSAEYCRLNSSGVK